jgi:hypothetical protein
MFFRGVHPTCPQCDKPYSRKSRGLFGRIFCSAAFRCHNCHRSLYYYRSTFTFLAPKAYCPKCHNYDLSRLRKMDHIDPMSRNPLRFLMFLLRFPLYYCNYCRLQFADWRGRRPEYRRRHSKQQVES